MSKTKIDAKDAVEDIRAGVDDAALMKKYKVSAKGLQSLMRKLADSGLLQPSEIQERIGESDSNIVVDYSTLAVEDTAPPRADASQETEDYELPTCLIISDDSAFPRTIQTALDAGTCNIAVCGDGPLTPEVLTEYSPHVILVDVQLKRVHYLHLIRTIHESDNCIALVLVTDAEHRHEGARALAQGAYGVMELPLEPFYANNMVKRCAEYAVLARFKHDYERIMETAIKDRTLEIIQTKDFLKGILDSSTLVSVVVTDWDQNILFWNKGAENIFGYSNEEMVGAKITKIYPPDALTRNSIAKLRDAVAGDGGTVQTKMRQKTKDGRMLTVELAVTPMLDEAGDIRGMLGIGLDVTEEVRQNKEIMRLLQKVRLTQDASILALARLTEARDQQVGSHLTRVQEYCRVLCAGMVDQIKLGDAANKKFMDDLVRSSVLHDVGKVLLPDSILLSEKGFSPEEREIMKQHPLIGGRALQDAVKKLGSDSYLNIGMEVAFYHHERWDGTGYPFGLKGEEIPLSARIVALADTYDALTTKKRHRKAYSHEQACAIIMDGKGKLFDPIVVDTFADVQGEFNMVRVGFAD